jgi:phytoene desaturase
VVTEEIYDPLDWEALGMERGTPFALAHTFRQTGPFRPRNVDRRVPGLVFVGSSTVPGVGVPMVLVSGKLAAARVRTMEHRLR